MAEEALDSFQKDRKAKSEEENTVDESAKNFSTMPPIREIGGSIGLCELQGRMKSQLRWKLPEERPSRL